MSVAANVLVGLVALLHVYFLMLEMFLWRTARGRATFGTTAEFAEASAPLAANMGLYNGFLAAGLVCALVAADPVGFAFSVFFLACVIIAGIYGGLTVHRRIIVVQTVPAVIALVLVLLAR